MGLSLWHLLVLGLVVLVVFGAGKLPNVMGDLGKGLRNFKSGLDGKESADAPKPLTDNREADKDADDKRS